MQLPGTHQLCQQKHSGDVQEGAEGARDVQMDYWEICRVRTSTLTGSLCTANRGLFPHWGPGITAFEPRSTPPVLWHTLSATLRQVFFLMSLQSTHISLFTAQLTPMAASTP